MKGTTDLGGDDQNPTSQERDVPMVEGLDDVDDADGIRRPVPERIPGLREDGDEHMLLHVEGPRVETELPAGDTELSGREDAGEEVAGGEGGNLHCDLGHHQRLRPVAKELVEEGHDGAGEEAQEPHPEGPDRERGVVDGRHRQTDLLHRRVRRRRLVPGGGGGRRRRRHGLGGGKCWRWRRSVRSWCEFS